MRAEDKKYILENMGKISAKEIARTLNLSERKVSRFLKYARPPQKPPRDIPAQGRCAGGDSGGARRFPVAVFLSILVVLTLAVYANSINGPFLLDDPYLLTDNLYVRSLSNIPRIFSADLGSGSNSRFDYYRPLQVSAYALVYNFWKLNVRPYHILDILLHVLVVLSAYWMIYTLFKDHLLSFFASLLYAVFPAHSETVAYISATGDCLVGLFVILSFTLYVRYVEKPGAAAFIALMAACIAAYFSKENALVLPVLFILYHISFRKKFKALPLFSVAALTVVYLAVRSYALKGCAGGQVDAASDIIQRVPGFFVAIAGYARILLFPVNLHMGYDSRLFSPADPGAIAGFIILAALIFLAVRTWRSNPLVSFSIMWFFINLMPVANLYAVAFYMADHYLYISSIGFFLVAAALLRKGFDRKEYKIASIAAVVALAAAYSIMTVKQNTYWGNPLVFFERTVKFNPTSFRALNNLGRQYEASGRLDEAKTAYEAAIKASPAHREAYNNLGNIYSKLGNDKEASALYEKAVAMNPSDAKALYNLANIYGRSGRAGEAEAMFAKAIELNPGLVEAYRDLASLYGRSGRVDEAVKLCGKAISIRDDRADLYTELGNIYAAAARYDEAVGAYDKAIALNPQEANAYNNIGNIRAISGNNEEALAYYRKAVSADPGFTGAYRNISMICKKLGMDAESAAALKRSEELEKK